MPTAIDTAPVREARDLASLLDVIQVDPSHPDLGGQLLIVQATTELGVRGMYQGPTERGPRTHWASVRHGEYAIIGRARWRPPGL